MICFDVSGSMEANDFEPNRLEAAKKVVLEFIENMRGNRMALVMFSGFAFTQSPLTFDHEIPKNMLADAYTGMVRIDGTAIGDALAVALNDLERSENRSKIIVLLTDGENNRGADPSSVAGIAKKEGIRIYTIGMGTPEGYIFRQKDLFGRIHTQSTKLNEELLRNIAGATGGKYYYGDNADALKKAYAEIAALEKEKVKTLKHRVFYPKYRLLNIVLILLLMLEFILIRRRYAICL